MYLMALRDRKKTKINGGKNAQTQSQQAFCKNNCGAIIALYPLLSGT
jgi:aromatic ring hydroxylase